MTGSLAYPLLAVLGMAISAYVWERVLDRQHVRFSTRAGASRRRAVAPPAGTRSSSVR